MPLLIDDITGTLHVLTLCEEVPDRSCTSLLSMKLYLTDYAYPCFSGRCDSQILHILAFYEDVPGFYPLVQAHPRYLCI